MDHILSGCTEEAVRRVWTLAKEAWPHNHLCWPNINLGIILGCGNLIASPHKIAEEPREPLQIPAGGRDTTRLLQILISKAAHLIWVLRCKRVIQERRHDTHKIEARWFKVINWRLMEDKITTTKIRRDKQYTN